MGVLSNIAVGFDGLEAAFQQLGEELKTHGGIIDTNEYFIAGKRVTREEAFSYIRSNLGK